MLKILLFFLIPISLFSQGEFVEIQAPKNIKTIQLFNINNQNHNSIIGFDEKLIISFDDIESQYQRFYFTIKHYDKNWKESDLMESQYIEGFFYDEITHFQPSFNTVQNYLHYTFEFPSANLKPKISGNYALIVYTTNKNKPIFTQRISIYESIAKVGLQQDIFNAGSQNLPNQIIRTQCMIPNVNQYQNQNISLQLLQNYNWNSIKDSKPQFIQTNGYEFNQLENVFYGGNEYYFFDTKNLNIAGLTTERLVKNDLFEAYLYINHAYPTDYEFNPDLDGEYYIRRNDLGTERDASIEGDYIWVNFAINQPKTDADIYVVGRFNNEICNEDSKMIYNENLNVYEKSILLKQGYYNYKFKIKSSKIANEDELNGNFWETKNSYQALIFYKDFINNFDRILGFGEIIQPK